MENQWTGPANMTTKRKICERDIEEELEKKRARMEDRLSNLPQDLQIRILSFLDAKQAVTTSLLSKRWVSLWTRTPVLEFNVFDTDVSDKFVKKVLCLRDGSAKLDRLIFMHRQGKTSAKIIEDVFDYAFSHGVKQLEVHIHKSLNNDGWPVFPNACLESSTSLTLQSMIKISCPILGPRSGPFKNLTVLCLEGATITDVEPFSGFPVLEKLTLDTLFGTTGKTLKIHACNLSDLTISGGHSFGCLTLTTPRLKFFAYRGANIPPIRTTTTTHEEGFPVLETVVIEFDGFCKHMREKKTFDDLLSFLNVLSNATSLTLFSSTVHILSVFQDELVKRRSPFRNLKCVKMRCRSCQYFLAGTKHTYPDDTFNIPPKVTAYLLHHSPDAKVTIIYPDMSLPDYVHKFP